MFPFPLLGMISDNPLLYLIGSLFMYYVTIPHHNYSFKEVNPSLYGSILKNLIRSEYPSKYLHLFLITVATLFLLHNS